MEITTFYSVTFCIFVVVVLTCVQLSKKSKLPPGTKKLPGPKGIPILGSVPELPAKHTWLIFYSWAKTYGPIYQVNLAGDNVVWISSPKIADDLLMKRQSIYSSRPYFAAIMHDSRTSMHYLPLMANGPDHQRGKLFAKKLLASMPRDHFAAICAQRAKSLILGLLGNPSTFQRQLERCTAGISSQVAWDNDSTQVALETLERANELVVGISPEAIENKLPFLRHIPEWVPNFLQPWKVEEIKRYERERAFWLGQREQVRSQVNEKTARYSWTSETLNMGNNSLNDTEAAYTVGMLALIGGMLESSPIQSWFLAMCHHPEWQARGQAEVDAVCGNCMPTAGDIQQLPIVRALIRETFRWRSPVPFGVPHYLEEDDSYEGYHIPKGSQVFALEWGLNRDEDLYPDSEAFRPERWLEPTFPTYKEPLTQYPQIKNHSGFGWGRRTCIGQDYSESAMITIVASILWSCTMSKKRNPETGLEVDIPWLDYGPFAIVRPEGWNLDIKPREEWRIKALAS